MANGTNNPVFKLGDRARIVINKRDHDSELERVRREVERNRRRYAEKEPRGPYVTVDDPVQTGRARIQFFDAATRFNHVHPGVRVGWALVLDTGARAGVSGEPDFVNGYIEHDLETNGMFPAEIRRIRQGYLESSPGMFGLSQTTHARREVPNCWPLAHDAGSLFLDAHLKRDDLGVNRKYVLGAGQSDWVRVQSMAQRRANFAGIQSRVLDPAALVAYKLQLEKLKLAETELWLSIQEGVTRDKEGILRPRGLGGGYDLQLDSPFYYEPFSTSSDDPNYKITRDPTFESESAPIGRIFNLNNVRVFLVPQYWRVRFSWFAWYLFVTFWAFTYIRFQNTRVFFNRFPLFPRWFNLGTDPDDPFGLAAAWQWIERSRAHASGASSDRALEFFTPFMAMIFIFTSDGIFEIRRTESFPGMLAAVVEVNGERRYIWRTTTTSRDLTIAIGGGKLQTSHINSFGAEVIGGNGGTFPKIF